jgi:hypothetical protein
MVHVPNVEVRDLVDVFGARQLHAAQHHRHRGDDPVGRVRVPRRRGERAPCRDAGGEHDASGHHALPPLEPRRDHRHQSRGIPGEAQHVREHEALSEQPEHQDIRHEEQHAREHRGGEHDPRRAMDRSARDRQGRQEHAQHQRVVGDHRGIQAAVAARESAIARVDELCAVPAQAGEKCDGRQRPHIRLADARKPCRGTTGRRAAEVPEGGEQHARIVAKTATPNLTRAGGIWRGLPRDAQTVSTLASR